MIDLKKDTSKERNTAVNLKRELIVRTVGDGLDYSYSICNLRGEEITSGTFGFSEGYCTNARIIAMQHKGLRPDMLLRK